MKYLKETITLLQGCIKYIKSKKVKKICLWRHFCKIQDYGVYYLNLKKIFFSYRIWGRKSKKFREGAWGERIKNWNYIHPCVAAYYKIIIIHNNNNVTFISRCLQCIFVATCSRLWLYKPYRLPTRCRRSRENTQPVPHSDLNISNFTFFYLI